MNKIITSLGKKILEPVAHEISKVSDEAISVIKSEAEELAKADGSVLKAYQGVKASSKKLFKSFDEFIQSTKARIVDFKYSVPENLYNEIEKAASENNFEFSKIIEKYYSRLNDCKTMDEVRKLFPEFKDIHFDPVSELTTTMRGMLSQDVCAKVHTMKTNEEKMNFLMSYFDKHLSKQSKGWETYPEFLKIQKKVAQEVISGTYKGNGLITEESGILYFNNPQMPIRFRFLGVENVDDLLLDLLKQIHLEGKNLSEAVVQTSNGLKISAGALQKYNVRFTDKELSTFKRFLAGAEANAKEFGVLGNLSKEEISSAVMTRAWTKSGLRRDFANESVFRKGWFNIKYILQKAKHPENARYSSEKIVEAFLLQRYKVSRIPQGGNPFAKFEKLEKDVVNTIRNFVNRCFKDVALTYEDKRILSSPGFAEFKEQYNVQEMIKSWERIEDHYKNIFFKRFWNPERIERLKVALNESYDLAAKNIKISEDFLEKAMLSAID